MSDFGALSAGRGGTIHEPVTCIVHRQPGEPITLEWPEGRGCVIVSPELIEAVALEATELERLRAIVVELVNVMPMRHNGNGWPTCACCDRQTGHDVDCVYRRAVEYMRDSVTGG